ncbi:hypothetical protein BJF79_45475 [Actinomadura sp. CNU-125]|nr:hypothetical protein BJF79_45475 [Actinomadura sp. CNU-125]
MWARPSAGTAGRSTRRSSARVGDGRGDGEGRVVRRFGGVSARRALAGEAQLELQPSGLAGDGDRGRGRAFRRQVAEPQAVAQPVANAQQRAEGLRVGGEQGRLAGAEGGVGAQHRGGAGDAGQRREPSGGAEGGRALLGGQPQVGAAAEVGLVELRAPPGRRRRHRQDADGHRMTSSSTGPA